MKHKTQNILAVVITEYNSLWPLLNALDTHLIGILTLGSPNKAMREVLHLLSADPQLRSNDLGKVARSPGPSSGWLSKSLSLGANVMGEQEEGLPIAENMVAVFND